MRLCYGSSCLEDWGGRRCGQKLSTETSVRKASNSCGLHFTTSRIYFSSDILCSGIIASLGSVPAHVSDIWDPCIAGYNASQSTFLVFWLIVLTCVQEILDQSKGCGAHTARCKGLSCTSVTAQLVEEKHFNHLKIFIQTYAHTDEVNILFIYKGYNWRAESAEGSDRNERFVIHSTD